MAQVILYYTNPLSQFSKISEKVFVILLDFMTKQRECFLTLPQNPSDCLDFRVAMLPRCKVFFVFSAVVHQSYTSVTSPQALSVSSHQPPGTQCL